MTNYYKVGTIVNTQGLQGELRILHTTDFPEDRFAKGSILALFDEQGNYVQDMKVKTAKPYKNMYLVKFDGYYHINDVEKFKGMTLQIAEENQSELSDTEFYYHEIIGCKVYEDEAYIGDIVEILQPGANDVWVVKRQGKRDLLLPYIPSVILEVNVADKRVNVDIMEGLDD
ncbi:ribosome maturation factor RimM [Lactococcus termiticola]|uniref:Ribosome maturation factor RimM n=1 Tax=Lactococcus termiticola TaxID=2169526 RepID=A0A2R5HHA8_9LACT|nr:ribosome maturation factor RimM [Lactococcus termiticola]GBG97394.1 16S rRNA processing protein RimM [Lactococcus termiticola]